MVFAHKGDTIGKLRADRTKPSSRALNSPKGFASCQKGRPQPGDKSPGWAANPDYQSKFLMT